MEKFAIRNWHDEGVVYNVETGDMHLLTVFHTELLQLLIENHPRSKIMLRIEGMYEGNKLDSKNYLDMLCDEFRVLNLIV